VGLVRLCVATVGLSQVEVGKSSDSLSLPL